MKPTQKCVSVISQSLDLEDSDLMNTLMVSMISSLDFWEMEELWKVGLTGGSRSRGVCASGLYLDLALAYYSSALLPVHRV